MPFVTACSFCAHRVKVPDRAMGACLCCPKCGSSFTVAPASLVPSEPPPPAVERSPAPPPAQPAQPPAEDQPWWVVAVPAAALAPTLPPAPVEKQPSPPPVEKQPPAPAPVEKQPPAPAVRPPAPRLVLPELPPPSSSSVPEWINAWGALAFFFAAVALVLAALSLPRSLSGACAGVGLLVGLAGVVARREERKVRDVVWLVLGGGGCGVLLLVVLLRPGWFNDLWVMDFEVPEPDRNRQLLVSRNNDAEIKELHGGERVDAAAHAIRHGDVLVRVESATVERLAENDAPVLLVKLHVGNVGQLHLLTYRGQASGEQPVTARDSRGQELARRELGVQAARLGQIGTVSVLPEHDLEDLVAVEAPWPGTAHVELDVPAAAWGGEGVCKFTIPNTFLGQTQR
jgi:hypothetical protein